MMYRIALPVLALLVAGGCGGSDATSPMSQATSPDASAAMSTSRQAEDDNDGENSRRSGALHVTKECSKYEGFAGQFCTITSSNLKDIAAGSRVVYEKEAVGGLLDSDLVLHAAGRGNQTAFGHVVLNLADGTGVVTFSGGTGKFKGFKAEVAVSIAPAGRPHFAWDGTYSYDR